MDHVQDDVLGGDTRGECAVDLDAAHLEPVHGHGLGGQDVAHLGGADPQGDGAERPVRRGVRVAAGDGHTGLGKALLGADDVDDAVLVAARGEETESEVLGVGLQLREHVLPQLVEEGAGDGVGGDDVVGGGDVALGHGHAQAALTKHGERLRAGRLVHEVQTDEELCSAVPVVPHCVKVEHLVVERVAHGFSYLVSRLGVWGYLMGAAVPAVTPPSTASACPVT
nr:hypothetical protein [Streptomyces sp. EL5]